MRELTIKEKIMSFMRREAYAPMVAEEMIFTIPIKEEVKDFWQAIMELEENGDIVKTRFGTYGLPEKMGLVVGRFQLSQKGFGFVIPDNKGERPDVFIPPRAISGAMNNDRVMARVEAGLTGRRPEGEIIRIITHANSKVVGTFNQSGDFAFVVPDDKRIGKDIYIMRRNFAGAKTNQKVVVEITQWPTERRNAEGRIVEILGDVGDVGLEIISIIKQNDLPLEFPQPVLEAAQRVPKTIDPKELAGRRDCRSLPIVTIDGEDAKDLDDAVHVRILPDGSFFLGVYIADVSHYVVEGSVLDREALERGTSVYLVDRVLPMLPERLSNGICSLNAGEDRLVMACEMTVDPKKGKILTYDIFQGVINVRHRLSYNIVRSVLEGSEPELISKYEDIVPMLRDMEQLARVLHQKRVARGAIDFDLPEQKVILDENKHPIDIVQRVHGVSESIIEEFMLAANEAVARHMATQKWPFVYRVHDLPAEDKMQNLAKLLNSFNVKLQVNEEMRPKEVQAALAQMADRPEERLVTTVALRCMRQAVYQTENIGHFGLAAEYYTHFTSPIRRYPDLLVHRLLHKWLVDPRMTEELRAKGEMSLEAMAEHASARERAAAEAERATVDLKKAEYMVGHIGEEYQGVISGVTAFGMFVEMPNGVEGLVHISSLTDDYYEFIEEQYSLVGTHTRNSYRLGDTVKIEVLQVNLEDRSIDFIMAGENDARREMIRANLLNGRSRNGGSRSSRGGSTKAAGSATAAEGTGGRKKKRKPGSPSGSRGDKPGSSKGFAKRGKGGVGGNKYFEAVAGKRKKRKHK